MAHQDLPHQFVLAEARVADDKQIESGLFDIDCKFNRFQRTLLSERMIQGFQISRGVELELRQGAAAIKR